MLKRLIEWIKSLFGKTTTNSTSVAPSAPSSTSPNPAPATAEEQYNAWRDSYPASTRAHIPTWEQKQERERQAAPTGAAVNRSGFVLSAEKSLVDNLLPNGAEYVYTFNGGGTRYRIFGVGGDEIQTVNGAPYNSDFIPIPPTGSASIRANGVGHVPGMLRYAVQLAP